jgi:hypothetical protein
MRTVPRVFSTWLLLVVAHTSLADAAARSRSAREHASTRTRKAVALPVVEGPRTDPAPAPAELAWQRGLKQGWTDLGWSDRRPTDSGGVLHDLKGNGGWILAREQPIAASATGGVSFTVKAPPDLGDFLEMRLDKDGSAASNWKKVRLGQTYQRALPGGALEVFVPMSDLNPKRLAFDRIVFFAYKDLASTWVQFDDVALTVPGDGQNVPPPDARAGRITIECRRDHPISPLIYGIAFYPLWEYRDDHQWTMKPTARRWGGNHTSRYNYELGEAFNAGADWFFKNLTYTGRPRYSWETFIESNAQHGVQSTFVLPMLGWVAKDTTSASYPAGDFPEQQSFESPGGAGNGRGKDGKFLKTPSPEQTSRPAPPEFIARWVKALHDKADDLWAQPLYILDNEPNLWSSTHHDLHPDPVSYDELWKRTREYASAIKKADPEARIAGPAEWGWTGYFYSQLDMQQGGTSARPDRRRHGDVPLVPWYLQQIAAYQKKTGTRLVDTLDLHFYPQAPGVGIGEAGDTSTEASLRRIRSTRALWDPTYHDESWIDDNVQLIPRMKQWVADNAPGMSTSIGEWNFGAERHISGGLAVAEALGRFGQQDLGSAYYWTYPPDGSAAYWAFRAYRDYDGQGSHFEDGSLPTHAPSGLSAFASVSDDGSKVVAVLLNLDPNRAAAADIALQGCRNAQLLRHFSYGAGSKELTLETPAHGAVTLEPFSINVIEWSVRKR